MSATPPSPRNPADPSHPASNNHPGCARSGLPPGRRILLRNGRWIITRRPAEPPIILDPLIRKSLWNMEELAHSLGICRHTLSRVAKESLGVPGKTWLRQLRIVRGRNLLREGEKIGTVASELGFRHHPDFTSEFRTWMGVSPSEFLLAERKRMFPPHNPRGKGSPPPE